MKRHFAKYINIGMHTLKSKSCGCIQQRVYYIILYRRRRQRNLVQNTDTYILTGDPSNLVKNTESAFTKCKDIDN